MSDDARSDDDCRKDDIWEAIQRPYTRMTAWALERRYPLLTPEQKEAMLKELADIQREQRELGLEQRGPALGPN